MQMEAGIGAIMDKSEKDGGLMIKKSENRKNR